LLIDKIVSFVRNPRDRQRRRQRRQRRPPKTYGGSCFRCVNDYFDLTTFVGLRNKAFQLWRQRCYKNAGIWYEKALELDGAADVRTILRTRLRGPFEDSLLPVLWPIVASYLAYDDDADAAVQTVDELTTTINRPAIADAAFGAGAGRHASGDYQGAQPFWRRSFRIYRSMDDADAVAVRPVDDDDDGTGILDASTTTAEPTTVPAVVNVDGWLYPAEIAPAVSVQPILPTTTTQLFRLPTTSVPRDFWIWSARGFLAGNDAVYAEQAANIAVRSYAAEGAESTAEALLLHAAALLALNRPGEASNQIRRGITICKTIYNRKMQEYNDGNGNGDRRTVPTHVEFIGRFVRLQKRLTMPTTVEESASICGATDLPGFRRPTCKRKQTD
jgi:tetratricopeptide (TPR) repeat protein